ncbi:hypothetical protein Ddye_006690 [Dipteronia dyeriana]|uniref:Uncharacterized protein n=1 Tax=Dipteronia dyeriana TaxID=168575 RepID=A0AAD9XIU8_9ROSI|nr:hypothetical protein Ddye_006690 [Dipteronia dyeriana]
MHCCSLNRKDIDFHYRRMSFRYHALDGINDESLRQVYLNSLLVDLQGELQRTLETSDHDFPSEAYQVADKDNLSTSPQIPVQVLSEKYSKHVYVIAYFDTGAHTTMKNPKVLPPNTWKESVHHFLAVDGQTFITNLVSKNKVGIQIFPSCTLWVRVIGTSLPDKDVLIGWDVYSQAKFLRVLPAGIRFK